MNKRFELIKPYIKGKTVLDIGCCGLYSRLRDLEIPPYYESEIWLHNKIKKCAASVTGIDISKEGVEFLKRKGYDIKLANAEDFNLNQKFDVVVAGELIEHLANFEGFLNSVRKHLKDNGLLILTTPNMFYFKEALFLILRGFPPVNPEHTCYFDEVTLRQLLNRFGFSVEKVMYATSEKLKEIKLKDIFLCMIEKMIPFKKIRNDTIIIIARKR